MKKLKLKKEVIARISNDEMNDLKGGTGSDWFCGGTGGTCIQQSCGNCPTKPGDIYEPRFTGHPPCVDLTFWTLIGC